MLVLSRKPGETLHIGNNIVLRVLEVNGTRVRLGIEAPHDVPVLRGELCGQWDAEPANGRPAACGKS